MIGLEFDHIIDSKKITKLSAILCADSVVLGLYNSSGFLQKVQSINREQDSFESIRTIAKNFPNIENLHICSKSNAFTFHQERQTTDFLQDKFTGSEIHVCFDEESSFDLKVRHFSTVLDHHYLLVKNDVMHFHFDEGMMHCYAKKNGQMVFYNSFMIEDVNDILYHGILVGDHTGQRMNENLILSGRIEKDSQYYTAMEPYFHQISFAEVPLLCTSNSENHYYFDHHVNILCG